MCWHNAQRLAIIWGEHLSCVERDKVSGAFVLGSEVSTVSLRNEGHEFGELGAATRAASHIKAVLVCSHCTAGSVAGFTNLVLQQDHVMSQFRSC